MATETTTGEGPTLTVTSVAGDVVAAYREMEMPVGRYVLFVLVPAAVFFGAALVVALLVDLPLMVRLPIPLLGVLALGSAVVYPKLLHDRRRREIEERLHLFITHLTILSTTNIDRVEVFRTLAKEREYGELANEAARIVQLVDTWNQSLDDACRIRARNVPSKPLSDLFDRLSYTISAGQELPDFLLSEQSTVIQNYVTIYESSLENLEVMKDLYLSMILSVTFALVFATVLPILTGSDPTLTVSAIVVMFAFVQAGFLFAIKTIVPYDPLWYHPPEKTTATERRIQASVAVGVGLSLCFLLGCALVLLGRAGVDPAAIPLPLYIAIPTTPLLIPGLVLRGAEQKVQDRDEEFTNFIRALGSSETAKQSTTTKVLQSLRDKDFGSLSENVDDLYKRLNMRIEPALAWRHFTADCRSYLIQKFSEMYLVGREMGGDPKQLGELISKNMNEVNQLRERRKQSTVTMIGVLYGISAASAFAFFIGLQVVAILSNMSMDLSTAQMEVGQIIHTGLYDVELIEFLLLIIILLNAVLSSLMIRIADGGHKINSYVHFVALTWVSCIVAVITKETVGLFINVG